MVLILAFLAFALAVVFHGFGFNPDPWFGWLGMVLIGAALLALHAVLGGGLPFEVRKRP